MLLGLYHATFDAVNNISMHLLNPYTYKSLHKYSIPIYILFLLVCLVNYSTPPIALALGCIVAQLVHNPFKKLTYKGVDWLLKGSVVGLGFGMQLDKALAVGQQGLGYATFSIILTLGLGLFLGRWFGLHKHITALISSGTAICGGSAIAAISPVINAKAKHVSIALGVVFVLNALALFIFPVVGHIFQLSEYQFGLWSAIAIHDTSAVVGAAQAYGNQALEIATTVKLVRALWIIPVSIFFLFVSKGKLKTVKIPYFIGLFVVAILINNYVPYMEVITPSIVSLSKVMLTVVLFLIGSTLELSTLKQFGFQPIVLGTVLWISVAISSLLFILYTT